MLAVGENPPLVMQEMEGIMIRVIRDEYMLGFPTTRNYPGKTNLVGN